MILVEGALGKVWRIIPVVTIVVLIFSLIESLTILPAHLAHLKEDSPIKNNYFSKWWNGVQGSIHDRLQMFIKNTYTPVLEWALKNRATTISIAISTFILSLGIVASGFLKFNKLGSKIFKKPYCDG